MKFSYAFTCLLAVITLLAASQTVRAELDFDQEVLQVPETHDSEKYLWIPRENPPGFTPTIARNQGGAESKFGYAVKLDLPTDEVIEQLHLFIVDKNFESFSHVLPVQQSDNVYAFDPAISHKGKYRLEIVLKTAKGWVRLNKESELLPGANGTEKIGTGDDGYQVIIRKFPAKVYAGHVVTLVFEIILNGEPVTDLETMDGAELHLASWATSFFKRFGNFIYATSAQNLGGPEAAVSLVFKDNGRHHVFAQFKHHGEVHTVDSDVAVFFEPAAGMKRMDE